MTATPIAPQRTGHVDVGEFRLAYEEFGDTDRPAIVLIMGLGTQLLAWPEAFCGALADSGFRVVRFDNRDIGLSDKYTGSRDYDKPLNAMLRFRFGLRVRAPYLLDDMAADTAGLIDALDLGPSHIVGASMGGMIAQLLTVHHPDRVASLTSVMSTTGARDLPNGKLKALMRLAARPKSNAIEDLVEHSARTMQIIASPEIGKSPDQWRRDIKRSIERSYYPPGIGRHLLAILASGSREPLLDQIKAPTLVLHGDKDPLVPPSHGKRTAQCIPGAKLQMIAGMGHDIPPSIAGELAAMIADHARSAAPQS